MSEAISGKALEMGMLLRSRDSRITLSPSLHISAEEVDILCNSL